MATRRSTRREQLLSDLTQVRRSPRLSQRYSQPPESTSSYPLVESRRSLRVTASVEPTSILNESGQSVPPSFYEQDVNVQKSTSEHFHGYTSQRGLPEHLYGLDESSEEESSQPGTRESTPVPQPQTSSPLQTPRIRHTSAQGLCPRVIGFFTSVLFKCGSLLYLGSTTLLCLDVTLLHRLFHSGVTTKSLARYWILPLIMLALMLFLLRGGVPDDEWDQPQVDIPHFSDVDLRKFQSAILKEVSTTLDEKMGSFRTTLKSEMEDHMNKRVGEVLVDSETRLEGTIGTTVDGEAKNRQKALTQLREDILNQLDSSLEAHLVQLQKFVSDQVGTITGQIDTERLDWVTKDTLTQATGSLKQELENAVKNLDKKLKQQMATMERDLHQNTSSVNDGLLGIQKKHEASVSDISALSKRVDQHDVQIASLEKKHGAVVSEIAAFKSSFLERVNQLESDSGASLDPSTVKGVINDELDKALANSSSALRLWVEQGFASKEDIEALLQGAGESASGEVTRMDVRQMIDLSLAKYSADKIGKFDFALENSGGSVIIDKCSKTYSPSVATVSVFGYPLWHVSSTPKVIIQPQVYPGDCWAFEGSSGYATIKLKDNVQITGITVEHIPRELSPNGSLDSAPKDIMLVGLNSPEDDEGEELGMYKYKADGGAIQQFDLVNSKAFQFVQFRFLSNYGHPNYTCVYRVRVHGHYT